MGGGPPAAGGSKKIFVGGLAPSVTEESFRQYFERYGELSDAVVMMDRTTNRSRGFGFCSFVSEVSRFVPISSSPHVPIVILPYAVFSGRPQGSPSCPARVGW